MSFIDRLLAKYAGCPSIDCEDGIAKPKPSPAPPAQLKPLLSPGSAEAGVAAASLPKVAASDLDDWTMDDYDTYDWNRMEAVSRQMDKLHAQKNREFNQRVYDEVKGDANRRLAKGLGSLAGSGLLAAAALKARKIPAVADAAFIPGLGAVGLGAYGLYHTSGGTEGRRKAKLYQAGANPDVDRAHLNKEHGAFTWRDAKPYEEALEAKYDDEHPGPVSDFFKEMRGMKKGAGLLKSAGRYVYADPDDPESDYWDYETPEDKDYERRREAHIAAGLKPAAEKYYDDAHRGILGERNRDAAKSALLGLGSAGLAVAAAKAGGPMPLKAGLALGSGLSGLGSLNYALKGRAKSREAEAYRNDPATRAKLNIARAEVRDRLPSSEALGAEFDRKNQDEYDRLNLLGKYEPKDWVKYMDNLLEESRRKAAS